MLRQKFHQSSVFDNELIFMQIVIISHPDFLDSKSMPLFTKILADGLSNVKVLSAKPLLYRLPVSKVVKKWLGYIDQYMFFPFVLVWNSLRLGADTIFVFSDQALGPLVPWVSHRPHAIHCHDFMALRSALGEIPENPTSFSGRIYQKIIRWGFSKGKNFISVSQKTREDLHRLAQIDASQSVVIHNPLNYQFSPLPLAHRLAILSNANLPLAERGMLLHVGGAQWYKNRVGVILLYAAYARRVETPLPLWMIGPKNQSSVINALLTVPKNGEVHLLSGLDAETLHAAYAHASLLLFPSLDEGFGWPIAEAHACGTPVLTTNVAPMTEVGSDAAHYHSRCPTVDCLSWADLGAEKIMRILSLNDDNRSVLIAKSLNNSERFNPEKILSSYKAFYQSVLDQSREF